MFRLCTFYRATPVVSHSSEDLTTTHTSEEHDHQSNGHLISSLGRASPQIEPYNTRLRRSSVDSGIQKNLTVNYERRDSTTSSSCSSSRPLSPIDDTNNLESLQSVDRPNTPQGTKHLVDLRGNRFSSPGIPHKYSDPASHDIPSDVSPQPPLRKGHTRASSVGASPLWSQKGQKRMGTHSVSVSQ